MSRRGLLAVTDAALDRAKRKREGKQGTFETVPLPASFPELPDTIREVLIGERETTGFYISGHPLEHTNARPSQVSSAARVRDSDSGTWLSLAGVLSEVWIKPTRRGSVWGGAVLEDLEGACQVFAFSESAKALADGLLVQVRGVVDERDGQPALKITDLTILERW